MLQKFKLTIELVPEAIWFSSIYNYYRKNKQMEKWHKLKKNYLKKKEENAGFVKMKD